MFYCELCNYTTEIRSKINEHHINPKENNVSNDNYNLVYLCPNCHNKIYIPESTKGIHSIKSNDSIIINGWLKSTDGRILSIIHTNSDNEEYIISKN